MPRSAHLKGWRYSALVMALSATALAGTPEAQPEDVGEAGEEGALRLPDGFQMGPLKGAVGEEAEVEVPEGWAYADAAATRQFLQDTGNLLTGGERATLFEPRTSAFIVFDFQDVGYVKDDEKNDLDADAMLKSIQEGTRRGNAERKKLGYPSLEVKGWQQPPRYDEKTHNLEWAPILASERGNQSVNYNVRILGRHGVMEAGLVAAPEHVPALLPELRAILKGYAFKGGQDYGSFVQGDKVAEYGLAALVTGGAVAVAAKSGLLQKFGKFIVLGIAGLAAALKKLFSGRKDAGPTSTE